MGKRIRRWARRFALLFPALLAGAWALLLFFVERAPPPVALDLPSRASVVDPRHRGSIGRARGHIRSLMRERRVPGLAIAVAREGRLLWSEAFGYADREKQLPATPKTPIRLASVSKPVTAAAMARLYEQGRLDLDAPIQQYVRSFPDKGRPITARQLASHRAGIRDYRDDFEALNTTRFPTATASLVRFRDDPLLFPPDTGFRYSVYGYVLLSAVLEGAAGQSFPRLLREQVFEPLGMRDSGAENSSEASAGADRSARPPPAPHQARPYDFETPYSDGQHVRPSPRLDFSNRWASGGLFATAEDMVRFGSAHMRPANRGFLRAETIDLLFTPRSHEGPMGYGLGWMTARDPHLRRVCFHTGAGSGATSWLILYPEQRTCIAILSNLGHARFPMSRMFGIVNPFLPDPARPVMAGLLLLSVFFIWRFWR